MCDDSSPSRASSGIGWLEVSTNHHSKAAQERPSLFPTGFEPLDTLLGGGLHAESLMLIGGPPGVGKTIFVLQAARNIAASGDGVACVVCFEHSEVYLYHRPVCMESIYGNNGRARPVTLDDIRAVLTIHSQASLGGLIEQLPAVQEVWGRIVEYWERLYLIKGHPVKTTLNVLDSFLAWLCDQYSRVVLFVDYLQKVPVFASGVDLTAEPQIRMVTEGLKNLALGYHVPIVAVAASDAEGLKGGRVRFEDLWGGASIKYEPDVAVVLNRSMEENTILFSIEKNRMGETGTNFSHQIHGDAFAFDWIGT